MKNGLNRRDFLQAAVVGLGCCTCAANALGVARAASGPEARPDGCCGVYCGSCGLYQASVVALREGRSGEIKCLGCKSEVVAEHCRDCAIKACALGRGLVSCADCAEYSCEKTSGFYNSGMALAVVAEKSVHDIREHGRAEWLVRQENRWTCSNCGAKFSFQDAACPNCGQDVHSCEEEAAEYARARDQRGS